MPTPRFGSIAEYVEAAPAAGQSHLNRLHALLKDAAPDAQEAIKWNQAFFVEPRFVFAFSAHKGHLSLAPGPGVMAAFRAELDARDDLEPTLHTIKLRYDADFPEDLFRRVAVACVQRVSERTDAGFWEPEPA